MVVMQPPRALVLIGLLALLNVAAAGCAKLHRPVSQNDSARFYAVRAASTAFYAHGPRQGNPDQQLPRDTPVRLLRYSPSFAKVALMDGLEGYVATDDIISSQPPAPVTTQTTSMKTASVTSVEIPQTPGPVPEPPLPEFEPTPLPAQP
jgi:hypothetical protein